MWLTKLPVSRIQATVIFCRRFAGKAGKVQPFMLSQLDEPTRAQGSGPLKIRGERGGNGSLRRPRADL